MKIEIDVYKGAPLAAPKTSKDLPRYIFPLALSRYLSQPPPLSTSILQPPRLQDSSLSPLFLSPPARHFRRRVPLEARSRPECKAFGISLPSFFFFFFFAIYDSVITCLVVEKVEEVEGKGRSLIEKKLGFDLLRWENEEFCLAS